MGLHVIIGEDDYLVDEAAKRIIGDGTGLEVVDSANSSNEDVKHSIESGMNAHQAKPVDSDLLYDTLKGLIK